ncbi:hypothetical protein niasHS_011574 [Heterodera schachtii]|uniref:Mos1 transposase HTH domain-containing protein n=2 Tax=Heterodera TaxID=34509 RepID=A0ABD2IJW0_HETSC
MEQQLSEIYAIRALLRHYWKKGTNAEETVRQICAVEGPNVVDIETAHNWFSRFECGHLTLEPKKTIWLPSETWDEVFKFVPFSDLHQHIQMTCQRFWALSEPILNRLCPRVAKPIKICWESEESLRRFEIGNEISIAAISDDLMFMHLEELGNGNLLKWEWGAIPSDHPPPNITGFRRIIIQGQLDRQLLSLLREFSTRIVECQMDFNDLDNFVSALASQRISLADFFASFSKCDHLILYRQIPAEFLACPYVLCCASIEIHWLEFEPISVLNWLKNSSGIAKKFLTVYGYYCDAVTAEPVNLMIATLISEYRGEPVVPVPEFVVDLCDFEDLYLAEFEDQHLALIRLSETNWRLISRTTAADQNDDPNRDEHQQNSGEGPAENGSEKTLIEIGRFFS